MLVIFDAEERRLNYRTIWKRFLNRIFGKSLENPLDGVVEGNGITIDASTPTAPILSVVDSSSIILGEIINEQFDSITDWSNVGSGVFSITNNKLQLSGGNNSNYDNYLRFDGYGNSNIESFRHTLDVYPDTPSASTYGFSILLKSMGTYSKWDCAIKISLDSNNFGKIIFTSLKNGTPLSLIGQSEKGLDPSTDKHSLSINYEKNRFIIIFKNTITGFQSILVYDLEPSYDAEETYAFTSMSPNSYRFSICAHGGTHLIDNFIVTAHDSKYVDYLFITDSIGKGVTTDSFSNRYADRLYELYNTTTLVNGGSGNAIQDINTSEIITLEPNNIIISVGLNNLIYSETPDTVRTYINNMVSIFESAGYSVGVNLFILLTTPIASKSSEIATYNGYLIADYGINSVIDIYSEAILSNAFNPKYSLDGIHANDLYHYIITNTIAQKFNILNYKHKQTSDLSLKYNQNGNIFIAPENLRGKTPKATLDVVDTLTNKIHIGNNNNLGGMNLGSVSDENAIFCEGCYYNLTWYASAANIVIISMNSGIMSVYANTGLTIGNSFVPNLIYRASNSGVFFGTTSTVPTAYVHLAGSTSAKSSLRIESGITPSSPNEGDIWFDGTDIKMRIGGITKTFTLT